MIAIYILFAIFLFGLLIFVHEGGHFLAAKACGVRVDEFALGMGPALWKKQMGETLYALRLFPIGGYCAMAGENEEIDDPRGFLAQAPWKRIIILAAGAAMNFLLGYLIVLLLYANASAFRAPVISEFMDGCPYVGENAFQVGDRILSVDGHTIYMLGDISEYLAEGETHSFTVRRDGKRVHIAPMKIVPVELPGVEGKYYGFYFGFDEATLPNRLLYAGKASLEYVRMVFTGLHQLISGEAKASDLSGPVGIVDLMAETGEQAASLREAVEGILYLAAFIAVNLCVMNLLPIPALDGGRIFLLLVTCLIEAVTRKKLDPKYEAYIHAAGMVLLLALMAFVMFNDIFRIVRNG